MVESEQFAIHAARFRAEAEEATLENVRERCLRAAAAWEERAETSRRVSTARAEREAATLAKTTGDAPAIG